MPRARLALSLFAFVLLSTPIAAEPPVETTSVTVADDTYGEGGTHQSFSNAKHELTAEVWRDKNGIVRWRARDVHPSLQDRA